MYWRFFLFVTGAAIAVSLAYWQFLWIAPASFSARLGMPGPYTKVKALGNLPLHLDFDRKRGRVLSRQEDGKIVSWNLATGKPQVIAQTSGLFGYCRDKQLLVFNEGNILVLLDLGTGERRTATGGPYNHTAWNQDCSTFVLASEAINALELWDAAEFGRKSVIETAMPVRNGLALSKDGRYAAAAEGTYGERDGHQTKIEIFDLAHGDSNLSKAVIEDSFTVYGIWKMEFVPGRKALFLGSQTKASAGLRLVSAVDGDVIWQQDGFASYWIRAIAASRDGRQLVTGDEKGLLRGWSPASGERLFQRRTGLVIQAASFSDDGRHLAIALWDSTIGILDLATINP